MKHMTGKMDLVLDKIFKRIDLNVEIIKSILDKDPKVLGRLEV